MSADAGSATPMQQAAQALHVNLLNSLSCWTDDLPLSGSLEADV